MKRPKAERPAPVTIEKSALHEVCELLEESEDFRRIWQRHSVPQLDPHEYTCQWQWQGNFTACRLWHHGLNLDLRGSIGMAKRCCGVDRPDRAREMRLTFSRAVQAEVADLFLEPDSAA